MRLELCELHSGHVHQLLALFSIAAGDPRLEFFEFAQKLLTLALHRRQHLIFLLEQVLLLLQVFLQRKHLPGQWCVREGELERE